MKKVLLSTAAVAGLAMIATPAVAQVKLELGGYFKGYGAYVDQDENNTDVNDFDFIRDTEIHIGGETTLDNGLTVGAHFEIDADQSDSTTSIDESYVYFSGGWGRINAGGEDGAGYLLQVAAPSADSNIDGIRQYVQPINYAAELTTSVDLLAVAAGLDYDMDPSGKSDKLTYLSPILSGFQFGVSYSPDTDTADDLEGIGNDNFEDAIGQTYEAALRYEGQFENVGVIFGAGYSHGEVETDDPTVGLVFGQEDTDDREVWNVGLDLDVGPFGIGAIYREDNGALASNGGVHDDEETIVVGVDYTTGPFKLGASYMTIDNTLAQADLDTERYSAGVTYTYGPGMTFRGSIGYVEHEAATALFGTEDQFEATYVTLGTQINF